MTRSRKHMVAAIDIGGTNVRGGLVDREGNITGMTHRPSHAAEGRGALLETLKAVIDELRTAHPIAAVGIGSPGSINHRDGIIRYMQAHIPGWTGTPVGPLVTEWTGVPAAIDNDVNLIALGENWIGAGKGSRCQLSIALGTGLGGGIVINGRVMRGALGRAAEFGHVIVVPNGEPCTCGNYGCVEVYTAPGAMVRRVHHYLRIGVPSALAGRKDISAKDIIEEGAKGDHLCRRLLDDAARCLALVVWNLMQIFDPDVFVIGGGLMKAGKVFLDPFHNELDRYYQPPELTPLITIRVSKLGDNAGILGAARLAWQWLDGTDRD
ncbi:ROK family protein [bacterium]|nr:ROK family protein [bacterium]